MNHPIKVTAIALLAALSFGKVGAAAPIVSVDMDPTTAGVQSSLTVQQGDSFSIDIFVSGVEPTFPLNGFQLTLTDGSALATAESRTLGAFIPAPPATPLPPIPLPFTAGSSVLIGGTALGFVGNFGSGVLATVDFVANAAGTTSLDLSNVVLTSPPNISIPGVTTVSGLLTIESGPSQLSAPPALALLLLGGLATWAAARRRNSR